MNYKYFEKYKFLTDCFNAFIANVPTDKVEETIKMYESIKEEGVELHTDYENLKKRNCYFS